MKKLLDVHVWALKKKKRLALLLLSVVDTHLAGHCYSLDCQCDLDSLARERERAGGVPITLGCDTHLASHFRLVAVRQHYDNKCSLTASQCSYKHDLPVKKIIASQATRYMNHLLSRHGTQADLSTP